MKNHHKKIMHVKILCFFLIGNYSYYRILRETWVSITNILITVMKKYLIYKKINEKYRSEKNFVCACVKPQNIGREKNH